jgi:predicted small metal-binding protein
MQDKMLSTLGQGFGAAARNDPNNSMLNDTMSPRGSNKVNFFEIRCKELQEEIDELHRLINENHGHDSILQSYIDQVQRKDKLLLERDTKLDDL